MNIVLNDSTPAVTPTNGCCASVADQGSQPYVEMSVNGSIGSGTSTITINYFSSTVLYYIGISGQYDGQTIQAGNWTVPLNVQSIEVGGGIVDSVYVCIADSTGATKGTIGSATGLGLTVTTGVNSFSISGNNVTFSTGDILVISFQMSSSGAGGKLAITHDQTITAPSGGGTSGALVQHVCGTTTGGVLSLALPAAPTLGNTLIVAGYGYFPLGGEKLTVQDTAGGNNAYVNYLNQNQGTASGGTMAITVYAATVNSNAGSPFTVTIQAPIYPSYGTPFLAFCVFEVSGLGTAQADVPATYRFQDHNETSLTCPSQTPTVTGDFAIALFVLDNSAGGGLATSWTSPSGFTASQSEAGQASYPVNGEIDYEALSSTAAVSPQWSNIVLGAPYIGELGGLILFRAGVTTQALATLPGQRRLRGLPATLSATQIVTPPPGRKKVRGLPATLKNRTFFLGTSSIAKARGLPCQMTSTGTQSLSMRAGRRKLRGLPCQMTSINPSLRVKRGPLASLLDGTVTIQEGEFYEAGIVEGSTSYTVLFMGGHDGMLKVVGGGDQVVSSGPPSWTPPANMIGTVRLWDTTNKVWYVSSGGAWTTK